MVSEVGNPTTTPQVSVHALIGRDERLLVIEHPGYLALPGGSVRAGEPVEQALRRALRDQLGATITALDFCAVVEHDTTQPGHPATSELVFLFDVSLTKRDRLDESASRSYQWAGDRDLSILQPAAVRDALIGGTLLDGPWQAWAS